MNIPCIAHRIGRAKEHSHLARLQIQTTARMLQEGDYRRGEIDPGEETESEEACYDCYYGRTEEDYE